MVLGIPLAGLLLHLEKSLSPSEEKAAEPSELLPHSCREEPPAFLSSVKQGWIISSPLITFLARQATIMIRVIESHASGIS